MAGIDEAEKTNKLKANALKEES